MCVVLNSLYARFRTPGVLMQLYLLQNLGEKCGTWNKQKKRNHFVCLSITFSYAFTYLCAFMHIRIR